MHSIVVLFGVQFALQYRTSSFYCPIFAAHASHVDLCCIPGATFNRSAKTI